MPQLKTYDLFISHAWKYHDDYDRLVKLLKDAPNFQWRNYSVPQHDPLHTNNAYALQEDLKKQIRPVNIAIILAGVYASYSNWIEFEIDFATEIGKPMIAVIPWGNQHISRPVQDAVTAVVGWNTSTIVDAIREHSL